MEIYLLIVTLILSAFFSASETAYVSSNRMRFQLKAMEKKKTHPFISLLSNAQKFLTVTLVGNNIVMVSCSTLAIMIFSAYAAETLVVIFTTIGLLVIGEIFPKSIAQQIPNLYIRLTSPVMFFFFILFYPLIKLAELISQFIISLFKGEDSAVNNFFRKKDIPILIREYFSTKTVGDQDRQMISRAVKINDIQISEIMIHRTYINGIESKTSKREIYKIFTQTGFSRLPVYIHDLDRIIGFIYFNDLLGDIKSIKKIIRPALILPKTVSAIKALNAFKKEGKSIAVVIDEYGGTAGLITVEDIIEEIFGNIDDEYDYKTTTIKRFNDKTILAGGWTEIKELNEKYKLNIPKGEYVTISGFIENQLGHIPQPGEEINLPTCKIIVTKTTQTRIREVFIKKNY
ncbi:HlyC/CorC family transporter [candidate division KSB1 bacterium]|nr:HlyC/CorC family transporter [candidate division KSB1 bacterium]